MTADHEKKAGDGQEVDIYRDTPVRLLGYANEVGEAFRALIHVNWVRASYGVASLYVLVSYGLSSRLEGLRLNGSSINDVAALRARLDIFEMTVY